MVRAVVARAEGGRVRVVGRGETALAADAIAGGLVVEPGTVTAAVAAALAAAERGVPAERTVIAIDGDDVRTYHVKTPFDREESGTPIVGADVTALAMVRERRVVGTRVFGLGRDAFAAREEMRDDDARVWAEIVSLPLSSENAPPPERWLFVGVPEALLALPNALAKIVGDTRGGAARIGPLTPSVTSRVFSDVPLNAEDLVAAGAAALATEVYS